MNKQFKPQGNIAKLFFVFVLVLTLMSCKEQNHESQNLEKLNTKTEKAEYFLLRPQLEKMYGYTQAVKVGNLVKVGGVISIDDQGKPVGAKDYALQLKTVYASLEKVLAHYGCSFDDVILENIYTTSMAELQKHVSYRQSIYTKHFPTGSWIGVKELGMPEMMVEIEIEALVPDTKVDTVKIVNAN